MSETYYRSCINCIVSHASGFGMEAWPGVPTCRLHRPNRYLPDDLRGTYERCMDVIQSGNCRYEIDKSAVMVTFKDNGQRSIAYPQYVEDDEIWYWIPGSGTFPAHCLEIEENS